MKDYLEALFNKPVDLVTVNAIKPFKRQEILMRCNTNEQEGSINRIDVYTEGVDYDSFLRNQMLTDAVTRNLERIGKAARNVTDETRNKYTEIPWKNMIGLRNILIHQYFGVDESIIWEVIETNLPEIKPIILKLIQKAGDIT